MLNGPRCRSLWIVLFCRRHHELRRDPTVAPGGKGVAVSGDVNQDGTRASGGGTASRIIDAVALFLARFGEVMGRLVLGAVYFLLLGPVAIFVRLFSDPLRRRRPEDSSFLARPAESDVGREAGRQG